MSKIYRLTEIIGTQALKLQDEELPEPKQDEVLVRIYAAGLNRAEWLFARGEYLVQPKIPSRLGVEGAGVIEALGKNVSTYHIGQEVCITPNMQFEKYGVLGEHAVVPVSALIAKPENLSWWEAASIWMAYPTAYGGLIYAGKMKENAGQTVLISAASSSVGLSALQIAKAHNNTVIATSRSLEKEATLKENGADYVVATNDKYWQHQVMEITRGKGFDIAFDPVTGYFTAQLAEVAAPEATIVSYGALSMEETPFPLFPAIVKGLNLNGFHVVYHLFQHPERFQQAKAHILKHLRNGKYKPQIDKVFDLEGAIEAYEYMDSGKQRGKIVIETV